MTSARWQNTRSPVLVPTQKHWFGNHPQSKVSLYKFWDPVRKMQHITGDWEKLFEKSGQHAGSKSNYGPRKPRSCPISVGTQLQYCVFLVLPRALLLSRPGRNHTRMAPTNSSHPNHSSDWGPGSIPSFEHQSHPPRNSHMHKPLVTRPPTTNPTSDIEASLWPRSSPIWQRSWK